MKDFSEDIEVGGGGEFMQREKGFFEGYIPGCWTVFLFFFFGGGGLVLV